jgi:hypothetical protein
MLGWEEMKKGLDREVSACSQFLCWSSSLPGPSSGTLRSIDKG